MGEPVGGICGGPWKWPKLCCGGAKCEKLLGGDGTMKCVQQHPADETCAQEHADCGGPGRRTIPCCAPHFFCKEPWPGAVMKCEAERTCAKAYAECGGPGRLTIPCCAPHLSCKAPWAGAVMKCM